jgi:predicted TIM-barrel fold metal-dependent hydrolase
MYEILHETPGSSQYVKEQVLEENSAISEGHIYLIIDSHAHMDKLLGLPPKVWMTPEKLVQIADRLGIAKVCVSSLKALTYDFYEGNEDVVKAMNRHPGRILGYVVVNPRFGVEAVEEVRKRLSIDGMIGIKLYGPAHLCPSSDESLFPVVEEAIRQKVPLLIHPYHPTDPSGGVEEIVKLAAEFPEAQIIMPHMGATLTEGGDWITAIHKIRRHENVLVDTCTSTLDAGMVEKAVEVLGPTRVLFATDAGFLDPPAQLARVMSAELTEKDKRMVLGENATRIFGLAEDT